MLKQTFRSRCPDELAFLLDDFSLKTQTLISEKHIETILVDWLRANDFSSVLLVSDEHTYQACGESLANACQLAKISVRQLALEPRPQDDHVVCEDKIIAALATVMENTPGALPIAVGSGSVNDIVKYASYLKGLDYISVPTAASMNGYTSAIAAILQDGVKRTLTAQQPLAVFVPLEVIAKAPAIMNQAGFGDLLSKPFCQADWYLSHKLIGVEYHLESSQLLDKPYHQLLQKADAIGKGELDGIEALMNTLIISGFSMAIAGSSAPASGGEHLISHYWDMVELANQRNVLALHGTQVGIATRLASLLYEKLLALPTQALRWDPPVWPWTMEQLLAIHHELPPEIVAEIAEQLWAKDTEELRIQTQKLASEWGEIKSHLAEILVDYATIDRVLKQAQAPYLASQIGVNQEKLVHTIRYCRHMRSRYSHLDLLDHLGLLASYSAISAQKE